MGRLIIPQGYHSNAEIRETERAIKLIKDVFERKLAEALNLERVSAPLFVTKGSGLNDNLNGVERPVAFDILNIKDETAEIVHSLAKWKRMALRDYGFGPGEGLYTDMNAIRRDEELDNLHSIYVDQWDWEKAICREDRTEEYLKDTVRKIIRVLSQTADRLNLDFPEVKNELADEVFFITSQELEDCYPGKTPKERENLIAEKHKTVFIMQIGGLLKSGTRHDGRAPDYDDWSLNGDIILWNDVLKMAFEISSMGIRVDEAALKNQLALANCEDRAKYPFHRDLLAGKLPLAIGGGIGQSRICMYLLKSAHIGEVQTSIWDEEMKRQCKEHGIKLL